MTLRSRLLFADCHVELRVTDEGGVTWAHVAINGKLRSFWSFKQGLASDIELRKFAAGLLDRIRVDPTQSEPEWWAEGWSYWGAGVPAGVWDYFHKQLPVDLVDSPTTAWT